MLDTRGPASGPPSIGLALPTQSMESWRRLPKRGRSIGPTGLDTANKYLQTLFSAPLPLQESSEILSSRPSLLGSGQATTVDKGLSGFRALQQRWQPYQRPSNWLENHRQSTKQKKLTNSQWHGSLKVTDEKTPLQHLNWLSQLQSQTNATPLDIEPKTNYSEPKEILHSLHSTASSELVNTPNQKSESSMEK